MKLDPGTINIGIDEKGRKEIAHGLATLLADSYTLLLKTHNYHWNVTGPMFQTLHILFEQQYTELTLAVDLVAERIRALGVFAPGSYAEFQKLTTIKEAQSVPDAKTMILELIAGHETSARTARSVFPKVEEYHDAASEDLLTQRIQAHEKAAWMLRSLAQ